MRAKNRLPRFKSEAEEADFWATHDSTDYWDAFSEEVESPEIDPALAGAIDRRSRRKQLISIRLEAWQVRLARAIAAKRGVPYHAVIRNWVSGGIRGRAAPS